MIRSKTYKIILLLLAFVMSMVAAVCSFATVGVQAETLSATPSSYFSGAEFAFEDSDPTDDVEKKDVLVATVKNGDVVEFKNDLMINNFEMGIAIGAGVEKVTLKLITDSYYINGNVVDGKLVKEAESEFVISGDKISITAVDGTLTVNDDVKEKQVKPVGAVGAKVSFAFELDEDQESAEFKIFYVDQNVGVDGYKQDFVLDANEKLTAALPRVALNDEAYSREYANKPVFIVNKEKSLSFSVYSVLGNVKASDVYLGMVDGDNAILDGSTEKPKWIMFETPGEKTVKLVCKDGDDAKVLEEITATAVYEGKDINGNDDDSAPVYTDNDLALDAFKVALKAAHSSEDGKSSLYLGATMQIPSLEDLVSDNIIPYSDLKTTVYYRTPKTSSSTSSMSFKLDAAGSYTFFVAFGDGANQMEEEDFMTVDGNDVEFGKYSKYIFSFDIADDATMTLSAPTAEGIAYKGVNYTSASFKIDAEGFKTEYSLWYHADENAAADAKGWIKIPKASSVTKEDYTDEYNNTYKSVKAVNYDGKLSFKPTKIGSYKIVCSISSDYTTRSAEESTVIRVTRKPIAVKVPSTWLQDNVWSVVFLSVGFVCLVGIVVLLFVKPKDETNENN